MSVYKICGIIIFLLICFLVVYLGILADISLKEDERKKIIKGVVDELEKRQKEKENQP